VAGFERQNGAVAGDGAGPVALAIAGVGEGEAPLGVLGPQPDDAFEEADGGTDTVGREVEDAEQVERTRVFGIGVEHAAVEAFRGDDSPRHMVGNGSIKCIEAIGHQRIIRPVP